MRVKSCGILLGVFLLVVPAALGAADYKNWLPLLPKTLGGLARSGEPDGMNMEMSGQAWSSLRQEYSGGGSKDISLTVVSGMGAPHVQSYQMMSNMKMETQDEVIKTIDVAGYKAIFQLDKNDKNANLIILVSEATIVAIEAGGITSETEMVRLAKELPLDTFAAQAK